MQNLPLLLSFYVFSGGTTLIQEKSLAIILNSSYSSNPPNPLPTTYNAPQVL